MYFDNFIEYMNFILNDEVDFRY